VRTGETLTQHFQIETRQHELFGLDLGDGVPRRSLVWGTTFLVTWSLLCFPILGMPTQGTFSLYFLPPMFAAYFAFQSSAAQSRRVNLTQWAIKVRYVLIGHRPIISLGARAATRIEYRAGRWSSVTDGIVRVAVPWKVRAEWDLEPEADITGPVQAGPAIILNQRATLHGFDYMQNLRQRGTR
jgi:hypothetical protein